MIAVTNPHHVSMHQLAQLHRYAGILFLSSAFNAFIVIAFFWEQAQHPHLQAWFAAVVAVSAVRFLYARGHQRAERGILSTGQQSGAMLMITAFNGLVWGSLALFLYPVSQEPYQMLLIFMLAVTSAGALPWYIASPGTYVLFLACVLAPLIITLSTGSGATEPLMALMLVIFAVTLAVTARTMHGGLMESLHKYSSFETLANIDNLTQLANRRAFDDTILAEWNRAARSRLPLSVIMIDVDNFKKYNDLYGHQEGDNCLRVVAGALARNVRRSGDLVARYGGEEFVVVLYQMARDEASDFAEQIRNAVASLKLLHEQNGKGYVTISLGGATCIPNLQSNPADLIRSADDALYEAKQAGRDQVQWRSMIG